jgi:4-diphosphocytidyl-2-C-methyl-D-erythritol kinase
MNSIIEKAPAKLNLFLDILNKRKDNYHDILSLMVKIKLFDIIRISLIKSKKTKIECNIEELNGKENIAYAAVLEMKKFYNIIDNFKIKIEKNIPLNSGLGGASSDAASIIKGINKLLSLKCNIKDMLAIGAKLGSDVCFFIQDYPWAIVEGRGEVILKKLNPKLSFWAILVYPNLKISTAFSYQKWGANIIPTGSTSEAQFRKSSLTTYTLRNKIKKCRTNNIDWAFLREINFNKFEELNREYKEIFEIKDRLEKVGAKIVSLTGSGSVVYGLFSKRADAFTAAEEIKKKKRHWRIWVVKTIN